MSLYHLSVFCRGLLEWVGWPAVLALLAALALALMAERYRGDAGRRVLAQVGRVAPVVFLIAFGLSLRNQYALMEEQDKSWNNAMDDRMDLRYLNRPELATGRAIPFPPPRASYPKTYFRIADNLLPQQKTVLVKDGDVIDYAVHCPADTLDWICKDCVFVHGHNGEWIQNREGFRMAKDPLSGKDQISFSGSLRVHAYFHPDQTAPLFAVGFGRCQQIEVKVRGLPPGQNPTS
jgi:hypothetical protein